MPGLNLTDLLMASGLLNPDQLLQAHRHTEEKHGTLEDAVLELKLVPKDKLYGLIADQLRVPYVDLDEYLPDPKVRELISQELARKHRAFPLFLVQNTLVVSMGDPADLMGVDALQQASGCVIEAYLSAGPDIGQAIDQWYGTLGETERFMEELAGRPAEEKAPKDSQDAPMAKLVDIILHQAVRDGASDIHIEPEEQSLRVRVRIDGMLHEIPAPPKRFENPMISRIKVLASLDIAENRVPQDGHFQVKVDDRRIDLRVSTLPTVHGENVVIRVLDTAGIQLGLEKMGFSPDQLRKFEEVIRKPYGIILSVGPTGSGKTTTLYSALLKVSSPELAIVTVEDPVEYRLEKIRQVQVNPKAGLTFASGLRSILRHDPDVIMVGEIRDRETAEIAIQAALTGHLVFSTLHTNDAPSSVTRLVNMGIEPFLVSASVTCIIAQRLVRLICESCKEWYEAPQALVDRLAPDLKRLEYELPSRGGLRLARGTGCEKCNKSGYRGRVAIYEMMVLDDEIREMILSTSSTVVLREAARRKGMRLLWEEGLAKALVGKTAIEEVARVAEQKAEDAEIHRPEPAGAKPVGKAQ